MRTAQGKKQYAFVLKNKPNSQNIFDKAAKPLSGKMSAFKKFLKAQAASFEPELRDQVKDAVRPEGKFIRPMLVFASAPKEADEKMLCRRAAIAELIHLSSLIHDDVIDNADIRRGEPTIGSKYGAKIAILLGDAIFAHTMTLSFEENNSALSAKASACVRAICEGEIRQTLADRNADISRDKYYKIVRGKTAVLFEFSCFMGAECSADNAWMEAAESAGRELGIAYQIYDDICDWVKSEDELGKTLGTDLLSGKQTYPLILLLEKLDSRAARKLSKDLRNSCASREEIIEQMKKFGIIDLCKREFSRRVGSARKILEKFPERSENLLLFCDAMDGLAAEE